MHLAQTLDNVHTLNIFNDCFIQMLADPPYFVAAYSPNSQETFTNSTFLKSKIRKNLNMGDAKPLDILIRSLTWRRSLPFPRMNIKMFDRYNTQETNIHFPLHYF